MQTKTEGVCSLVVEHVLAGFPGPKEKKKKGRKENF
jgi:hypothetical protein